MTVVNLTLTDLLELIKDGKKTIGNPDGYSVELILHEKLRFPGD